jgi:hypothetical protein
MKSLILFMLMHSPLISKAEILKGVAQNKKDEILYYEKHEITKDSDGLNKFIKVEYSKPDGIVFAEMTSDFSKNKTVPDTVFKDQRFNTKNLVSVLNNSVEFKEYKNNELISEKTIPLNESMVVSQGFDNFILINRKKLDEEPVDFKFGLLEKKDFFSLTGYKKSKTETEVEYGIRSSSWFIRLFINELNVIYDLEKMRLKAFIGRSNVLNDSGKPQDVVIKYEWINTDNVLNKKK